MEASYEHVPTEPMFAPVKFTLTLETQSELDALGSMFNNAAIIRTLDELSGRCSWGDKRVYDVLRRAGADINQSGEFGFGKYK